MSDKPNQTVPLSAIFKNPNFLKFWFAQLISYLGDRIDQMAMIFIVSLHATAAERAEHTNMITFYATLPYVFLSPFAGAIIDRFDRRKLMVITDIFRGLVVLVIPFTIEPGSHPEIIYGIVFMIGMATCIFAPAKSAFVPEIVPETHLLRANSVTSTMGTLTVLIGTIVGSLMVSKLGYHKSFIIDAITYFASAALLIWIRMNRADDLMHSRRYNELKKEGGFFTTVKDGFSYIAQHRLPAMGVLLDSWYFLVGGTLFTLITQIVNIRLVDPNNLPTGETPEQVSLRLFGYACGCLGVGLAAGGLLTGRYGARMPLRSILTSNFMGAGVFIALLATKPGVAGTLILFALIGYSGGGVIVSNETVLQKAVPDQMRGRVFALNGLLLNMFLLISIAAGSAIASKELLTMDQTLLATASLAALGGVVAFFGVPKRAALATMRPQKVEGE